MKILCPSCNKPIPGDDIDLKAGRAVCRECAELVMLPSAQPEPQTALTVRESLDPGALAPALFKPDELRLVETKEDEGLRLVVKTGRMTAGLPILIPGGFFAAGFLAFLISFLSGGPPGLLAPVTIFGVMASVFGAGGAATLLARGTVRLGRGGLEFQPPTGGRKVREPLENLVRFVYGEQSRRFGVQHGRYCVKLLTVDGRSVDLRLDLPSADHARYLAGRLNRALDELRAPVGYRG